MAYIVLLIFACLLIGQSHTTKLAIIQDAPMFEDRLNLTIKIEVIYNGERQVAQMKIFS